ncbi:hypothetical protein KI387_012212, partial [Taxus chinensis]
TAALRRVTVTGPPPCAGRRLQDRRPGWGGGYRTAALGWVMVTGPPTLARRR